MEKDIHVVIRIEENTWWFVKSLAVERRMTVRKWVEEAIKEKVANSLKEGK